MAKKETSNKIGVAEAAELAKVTTASIYNWASKGLIKSYKAPKATVDGKVGRPSTVLFDAQQIRAVAVELGHRRK